NRVMEWDSNTQGYSPRSASLELVDLSDPSSPERRSVALAPGIPATGLFVSGSVVATSHFEPSASDPSKVRFYLDRVDLADPEEPVSLPPVNIPGSLLAYDAESGRAVTVDYRTVRFDAITASECYEKYGGRFETKNARLDATTIGSCTTVQHVLALLAVSGNRATLVDGYALAPGEWVQTSLLGDDRLFLSLGSSSYYRGIGVGGAVDVAFGPGGYYFSGGATELLVLGGIRSDALSTGRLELDTGNFWSGSSLLAVSGERAVVTTGFQGGVPLVDATDPTEPRVVREVGIAGGVHDVEIVNGTAVIALGYDGVETIPIGD